MMARSDVSSNCRRRISDIWICSRSCAPLALRRIGCQGAAARRVATRSTRASPPMRPGRDGRGRPRRFPFFAAPEPLAAGACRAARPACRRAKRSGGSMAFAASISISTGGRSVWFWSSPSSAVSASSGLGGSGSVSGGGSCVLCGSWVARGARTNSTASVKSACSTRSSPISAALARASASACSGARSDPIPNRAATSAISQMALSGTVTRGKSKRASANAARSKANSGASDNPWAARSRWIARRSAKAGGGVSSGSAPSSKAIKDRPLRASIAVASRAANPGLIRSAMGISKIALPSNIPRVRTTCPSANVAAKSIPPKSASSPIPGCSRRKERPCNAVSRPFCTLSLTGPTRARSQIPPSAAGSSAKQASARLTLCQRSSPSVTPRPPPPRGSHGWSIQPHPADRGAGGGAARQGPRGANDRG